MRSTGRSGWLPRSVTWIDRTTPKPGSERSDEGAESRTDDAEVDIDAIVAIASPRVHATGNNSRPSETRRRWTGHSGKVNDGTTSRRATHQDGLWSPGRRAL